MGDARFRGATSQIVRFIIKDTANNRLGGLTNASTDLAISTLADNEAAAVNYLQSAGNIETIATPASYVAPSANKCRFKEVDAVYQPGLYEFQFANARFAIANVQKLVITVTGESLNIKPVSYQIDFVGLEHLLAYVQLLTRPDAFIKADRAAFLALINRNEGSGVPDPLYDNELIGTCDVQLIDNQDPTDFMRAALGLTSGNLDNQFLIIADMLEDKDGYRLAPDGLEQIIPADPGIIVPSFVGQSDIVQWIAYLGAWSVNPVEVNETDAEVRLKNTANNANLAQHAISDDGNEFVSGPAT